MSSTGTYGDHITLFAASEVLDTQIVVISSNDRIGATLISASGDYLEERPFLLLGHVKEGMGEHYVCLQQIAPNFQFMSQLVQKHGISSTSERSFSHKLTQPEAGQKPVERTRTFMSDWMKPKGRLTVSSQQPPRPCHMKSSQASNSTTSQSIFTYFTKQAK
jgi:hypothetical protein